MKPLSFVVPLEWENRPVKEFVRRYLGFSARTLVELKQTPGGLLQNGTPARAVDLLQAGDTLTLTPPDEQQSVPPVELTLSVAYEDDHYLVVNKPPQMPVHPSPGHDADSLCNAVAFYYQQTGQRCLLRPLYRLDRDTSGLVVFAKHRPAAAAVLQKTYFAVCEGSLTGTGTIDLPIGLTEDSKIRRVCGVGSPAVTHWHALQSDGTHTLLELTLETGRTHQIRAHLSHLGHPLAGDDLYGGSRDLISRQALHCGTVRLSCAPLAVSLTLAAPLPNDMAEIMKKAEP